MPQYQSVVGEAAAGGMRLDRYVSEVLQLLSRSQVKARNMQARCNGKQVKVSRLVEPGDMLELQWDDPEPCDLLPENIPLDILYEDARVVVINKPQGMVVHPGAGNCTGTLAHALLYRRMTRPAPTAKPERQEAQESKYLETVPNKDVIINSSLALLRPGIVHRLDKDTSGVIIATYDDEALVFLADQFKQRSTRKTYVAIVKGRLPAQRGKIETYIVRDRQNRKRFTTSDREGKHAVTLYKVIGEAGGYSLVLLRPKTGRTHQLRVHMRYLSAPILGDPIYARPDPRFPSATLMLHALRLSIVIPGEQLPRTFTAPLPERFKQVWRALTGKNGRSARSCS
ncbi:MAG: RluA family pseudouridine synthase [Termitinemataceae bacterium]